MNNSSVSSKKLIVGLVISFCIVFLIFKPSVKNKTASIPPTPTPTIATVKQLKLNVNYLNVKRLINGCRYFFNIRNAEDTDFNGSVSIGLHKQDSVWPDGSGSWDVTVKSGGGFEFNLDADKCPTIMEVGGFASYSYSVKNKSDQEVATGSGQISSD